MDFKVNRELLSATEVVYDGLQEQSVELDYILPDYFPDIFRIVKCVMKPRIMSHMVYGSKITLELSVYIKVLYCSESSNAVQCAEQKLNYSKTVDIGRDAEKMRISHTIKTDYVNCRAVNKKRLDVRGAVSIHLNVSGESTCEAVSDAFGMNIQLKKSALDYTTGKMYASKTLNMNEEFELGSSKPSVTGVIRSDAVILSTEKKIIVNKLIVKGEMNINILYTCESGGEPSMETMQFLLPFSQIVDMEGIEPRYESNISVTPLQCEIHPSAEDSRSVKCDVTLRIDCCAYKQSTVDIVSDAYSTKYECSMTRSPAKIEYMPTPVNETQLSKASVEYKDGEIKCIYDAWGNIYDVSSRYDTESGKLSVIGNLQYSVMIKNTENVPELIEKDVPFEFFIDNVSSDSRFEGSANIVSCSYNMVSTSCVDVKSEIRLSGLITGTSEQKIISSIDIDEEKNVKRDGDYALKLYYAQENEDVWEIAKKYYTSVDAICDENMLEDEVSACDRMLLIPIVNE